MTLAQGRQHGLLELSIRPSLLAAARAAAAGAANGDAQPDQSTLALQPLNVNALSAGKSVRGCALCMLSDSIVACCVVVHLWCGQIISHSLSSQRQ